MINGIINVYKEKGFTSFDVVAKMRGIFHQKKIGHTGTLDPDAEGVLPVCLGKATRVCDLLTDKDKEYEAVLLLGQETDTQDISGEVLNQAEVTCSPEKVEETILSFVGDYMQVPPMYSALKVNGQKLCDLARKGVTVARQPRPVKIFDIQILEISLPEVRLKVHCSKGTYIRTLCQDIGSKLGCYGCVKSLLRTRVSEFTLENAYRLSELEDMVRNTEETENYSFVQSVDRVFLNYPAVSVKKEAGKMIRNGNRIPVSFVQEKEYPQTVRLYDNQGLFVGLYSFKQTENDYKPIKIFMDNNEIH